MFLTCWVASYVMSACGRDDNYLISQTWLRSHQDTFVKDIAISSPCETLSQLRLAPLPWHTTVELQLFIDIAQTVSVVMLFFYSFSL